MKNYGVTFLFQNLAAYSRPLDLVIHAKNAMLRGCTVRSIRSCLVTSDPMMIVE